MDPRAMARKGYPDAVPGSMAAERHRRRELRTVRGPLQRWRDPDGGLHRTRRAAGGDGAVMVTVPRETL